MTGAQFYEVLGEVREDYVREARAEVKPKKAPWRKWGAVAACLCLVIAAAAFALRPLTDTISPRMVSGYPSAASGCYAVPEPGSYFCFVDVNEARKHYAGRDVSFLLAFDLFKGSGGNERISSEELSAEYQRLAELGFRFYEVEVWTYRDVMEKEYYTAVLGVFTEEDLADFPVNPEYGYAFHFVYNGDHSSLRPVSEDQLITSFDINYA